MDLGIVRYVGNCNNYERAFASYVTRSLSPSWSLEHYQYRNYAMPPCNLSNALIRTSNRLPISSLRLITRIDLKAFPFGLFDLAILPSSSNSLVSSAVGFSTSLITIGCSPVPIYSAVLGGHVNASEKEFLSISKHFVIRDIMEVISVSSFLMVIT